MFSTESGVELSETARTLVLLWYIMRMEVDDPPFSQAIQRPIGECKGVAILYFIKWAPFGAALSSRKISNDFFF